MPRHSARISEKRTAILGSQFRRKTNYDHFNKTELRRNLIVYTTRIDEMNILNMPIEVSNPSLFIKGIIKESLPRYIPISGLQPNPKRSTLNSTLILRDKIDSYNAIVKTRTSQPSYRETYNSNAKPQKVNNILSTLIKPVDSSKSYIAKNVPSTSPVTNPNRLTNCRSTFLILRHGPSLETDVYFFNESGDITQHLKTEDSNCKDLEKYFQLDIAMKIDHCCWYRRINCIFSSSLGNSTIIYLKKPHKCIITGDCNCCCKKNCLSTQTMHGTKINFKQFTQSSDTVRYKSESGISMMVDNETDPLNSPTCTNDNQKQNKKGSTISTQLYNTFINNTFIDMRQLEKEWMQSFSTKQLTEISTLGSIIEKYFEYNPLKSIVEKSVSCDSDFLKCTYIQIIKASVNEYEHYKIGPKGEIEVYYNKCFKDLLKKEEETISLCDEEGYDKITVENCCWYARKSFIDKLRLKKLSPSSLKFITTRHKCPKIECTCCCRFSSHSSLNFKSSIDLSVPNYLLQRVDTCKKGPTLKFSFSANKPPLCKDVAENSKSMSTLTVQDIIRLGSNNLCDSDIRKSDQTPTITDPNSSEINTLVSTILKRFKGIQLSISEEGKIVAKLNCSESTLTSDELDILVQILKKVQKEVNTISSQGTNTALGLSKNLQSISELCNPKIKTQQKNTKQKDIQSSSSIEDNIIVIDDDETINSKQQKITKNVGIPDMSGDGILLVGYYSDLISKKREYYLDAFDIFLKNKQGIFNPTIKNVISLGDKKDGSIKRKAAHEQSHLKKRKNISSSGGSESSNSREVVSGEEIVKKSTTSKQNQPISFRSNVNILKKSTIKSVPHTKESTYNLEDQMCNLIDGNKPPPVSAHVEVHKSNIPAVNEFNQVHDSIRKPSSPILKNMLSAPPGPMREVRNEIIPPLLYTSQIPESFDAVCSNDPLVITIDYPDAFPKVEPVEENSILGV